MDKGNNEVSKNSISPAKQVSKRQLLEKLIITLNTDTCFMYNESAEVSSAAHNAKRSEDDVARAWAGYVITPSDLFVIYSVYLLSFATVSMVADMLKILKRKMPDKNIPVIREDSVRSRIIEMCQSGVLAGKKITMGDKKVIIYTCVHNGFRLLQMQMQGYIYADDMLLALNDMMIYERTACSYCAVALASLKGIACQEVQGFGEDRSFGKEYRPKVHAKADIRHGETEYIVAFEPIYYVCNEKLDIYENLISRHRNRLKSMLRWAVSCQTVLHKKPKIIIVCENMDGLKNAAVFIHGEISELEPYVSYTSETVLRELRGSGLERAGFIRVNFCESGEMAFNVDVLFH